MLHESRKDMVCHFFSGKASFRKILVLEVVLGIFLWASVRVHAQSPGSLASYFSQNSQLPRYQAQVVATYPHDPTSFTQGLVYKNGILYESSGLYGESSLRKVELATGKVIQQVKLKDRYFAEGLTLLDGTLVQLSWKSQRLFRYRQDTLELISIQEYPYQGWGITYDGNHLITSDGSHILRFLDPEKLSLVRELAVTSGGRKIERLNELEYINGKIYANVWQTSLVVIIDPQEGEVVGWIDLSCLEEREKKSNQWENVLNGIAYYPEGNQLLVTGKRWSRIYQIKLREIGAE